MLEWFDSLNLNGWYLAKRNFFQPSLKDIIYQIKPKSITYSLLIPKLANNSNRNSLSSVYGFNEFPLHTDGAHNHIPPHYIILCAPPTRQAKTKVINILKNIDIESYTLKSALFRIRRRNRHYPVRFLNQDRHGTFIRFNQDCMKPLNQEGKYISNLVSSLQNEAIEIDWHNNRYCIIDNHKCCHGRSSIPDNNKAFLRRLSLRK